MNIRNRCIQANILRYKSGTVLNDYLIEEYHQERLNTAISLLNDAFYMVDKKTVSVLEIASGNGAVAKQLKVEGYNIYASDVSIEQIEYLTEFGISIIQVNASGKFPFKDDFFDAIFAGDIIEHLFDVDVFLQECNRVLKEGGVIILTTPNLASLQDRFRFFMGESPKQIQPCHEFYKLHIRPFTLKLLKKTLLDFGFEVKKCSSNFVIWKSGNKHLVYSKRLAKLFPGIGRSLIVYGKKI